MTGTSIFRRFAIESSIDRRVFFSLHALFGGSARGSIAKALVWTVAPYDTPLPSPPCLSLG